MTILLGIWYDLFFDTIDLGAKYPYNKYGPITFCFDIELLQEYWLPKIWVTRTNPIHWKPNAINQWLTQEEISTTYDPISSNAYQNHLVVRNAGGVIRLGKHLKEIIVDDPEMKIGGIEYLHIAQIAIYTAFNQRKLPFTMRERKKGDIYRSQEPDLIEKFFLPY